MAHRRPKPSGTPAKSTARPESHRVVIVNARGAGRRLDVYLSLRFPDWSRTRFARFIREGLISSELRTVKPSSVVHSNEVLRILVPGLAPEGVPPPLPPVLYEDESLFALDKPSGLLMHSVGQRWSYGVIGVARHARPDAPIDLAHRLDRETSGVVLLTKTVEANRFMKLQFSTRLVGKVYWALVHGSPQWESETCELPLGPAGTDVELRQGHVPSGATARTRFKVLQRLGAYTLVACRPYTGRTHQIRVHLELLGFPILGDKLYGQPGAVFLEYIRKGPTDYVRQTLGFSRHALHARMLTFAHPTTGQAVRITSPLPDDMQRIVDGAAPVWP